MKILLNNNARKGLLTPRLKKTRMQSHSNQKQNRAFEQTPSTARKTVFSCYHILVRISRRVHLFTRMRLVWRIDPVPSTIVYNNGKASRKAPRGLCEGLTPLRYGHAFWRNAPWARHVKSTSTLHVNHDAKRKAVPAMPTNPCITRESHSICEVTEHCSHSLLGLGALATLMMHNRDAYVKCCRVFVAVGLILAHGSREKTDIPQASFQGK